MPKTPFEDDEQEPAHVDLESDPEVLEAGGSPEVEISVDKEDDDDDEKLSRDEKKRNRFQEAWERASAAEARAQAAEQRIAQLEARFNQPQPTGADPIERELEDLHAQRQAVSDQYWALHSARALTPQQQADLQKRDRDLEERIFQARLKRSQPQAQPQLDQGALVMTARFADIYSDEKMRNWAMGRLYQRMAEGRQDSMDLRDEVADETRRQFRKGPYKGVEPSAHQRSAHSGAPRGGSAQQPSRPKSVKMTPEIKAMANAAYSHIPDEKKRYEMWVKANGKQYLESTYGK